MKAISTGRFFTVLMLVWVAAALAVALLAARPIALCVLPIAVVLWYSANAHRVTQTTQLVLPVLLLPGALMCFVGMMQAFGYGRMADEAVALTTSLRAAFFVFGLTLHFAAYLLLANESRASDHVSGKVSDRV